MIQKQLVFRLHAVQRMFQRNITIDEVKHILKTGTTIEDYIDDIPYASRLVLGWCGSRPLHVVVAENKESDELIVITVYEPDPAQWGSRFTRRI